MDHIKNTLSQSNRLKKLLERYQKHARGKSQVLSLLSPRQQQDIVSVSWHGKTCVIVLKNNYGVSGIRQAMRNFEHPYTLKVSYDKED